MGQYTVAQLARLAGVTIRTLHHYDEIGLLRPATHSNSGYRLYGRGELLKLQQILFFKELDLPLDEIKRSLSSKNFDPVSSLKSHREKLIERSRRLQSLLETIDKTILHYDREQNMLSDADIYEGFSPKQIDEIKTESRERWGKDRVEAAERKMKGLTKAEVQEMKAANEALCVQLAASMTKDPADPAVQLLVAKHHAGIEFHYKAGAEIYRGLGRMYVEDPRFTAYYEKYATGLAAWLCKAMEVYADKNLT